MKKALSLFLAVIMVVGMIPLSAITILAATPEVTLSDDAASAEFTDLNAAIAAVDNGGTIKIVGTYTYASNYTWTDHDKTVTIKGASEDGSDVFNVLIGNWNIHDSVTFTKLTLNKNAGNIYANGNPLRISEDVIMESSKVNIIAGGNGDGKAITGDTKLELYAGSYKFIFGGSYAGTVNGNTHVTIGGSVNKMYSDADISGDLNTANVYGGGYGNGDGSKPGTVTGNASVIVEGNARANNAVGGVAISGTIGGSSSVTVKGGTVYRVIGGGRGVAANNTFVTVTGGNVREIYGGSMNAAVKGDTNVYVGGTANASCNAASHSADYCIYGGGYSEDTTAAKANTVGGNTYVTVDGSARANYVFGGGSQTTTSIGGTAHVAVKGGTYMSIYGGGRGTSVIDTVVTMTGGTIEQLFGGSESAAVTGNTLVRVLGGTISRRIYGGSYNEWKVTWKSEYGVTGTSAVVLGSGANITLTYDDSDRSIYAGSRYPSDVDGTTILAYLDAEAATKYRKAAYQGAQDGTMQVLMGSKAVADEIHTLSHTVNGNVITESCTDSGCGHTATVSLVLDEEANLNYIGEAITPAVIRYSGNWLAEEIGTEITYANNNKAGAATATATHARIGNVTLNFEITDNVIEVYSEDKEGDDKVSLKSLIGTTLTKYTTYKLMENVDLGGGDPLESYITLATGVVFDGGGHSVTGFSLKSGSSAMGNNISLFRATGSATIQNLTLGAETKPIEVSMVDAGKSYAVVMADIPGGATQTFKNITVYTTMTSGTGATGDNRRGGAIAGRVYGDLNLTNCTTYGSITDDPGKTGFGGMIGLIPAEVKVTITGCTNHISINTKRMAGGFIGQSMTAYLTMRECVNNGTITVTDALAGGIMGQYYSKTATTKTDYKFENCVNNGAITGNGAVAGFFGEINSKSKTLVGAFSIDGFTQNANVTESTTSGCAGALIGKYLAKDSLTVSNSVNKGELKGGFAAMVAYAPDATDVSVSSYKNKGAITTNGNLGAALFAELTHTGKLTVQNCENTGNVTTTTTATWRGPAGLFGKVSSKGDATMTNLINRGTISASLGDNDVVGGIVGYLWLGKGCTFTMSGCVNYGNVTATTEHPAGGIFGATYYETVGSGTMTITDCVNRGSVSTAKNAGGLVGSNGVRSTMTIRNFENHGRVHSTADNAGGITGWQGVSAGVTFTVDGMLNTGVIKSNKRAGVVVGNNDGGIIVYKNIINLANLENGYDQGCLGWIQGNASVTVDGCVNTGTLTKNNKGAMLAVNTGVTVTYGATAENVYLASVYTGDVPDGVKSLADLDAVLAHLKNDAYSVWNGFMAGAVDKTSGKATSIVLATPVLFGVQMGTAYEKDGKEYTSARFVGTIGNSLRYQYIGLTITLKGGKTKTVTVPNVYKSILAGSGEGQSTVTAESLGGTYIFAITMKDIPTTGTYEFTVTSYAVGTDGTEYSSDSGFVFVFENGALKSKTPYTAVA